MRADRLDTAPLTDPLDRRAVRAFRRTLPKGVLPGRSLAILCGIIAVLTLFPFIVAQILIAERELRMDVTVLESTAGFLMLAIPALCVVVIVRTCIQRSGRRQFRLDAFATANRMVYRPIALAGWRPGMIFAQPSGLTTDLLQGSHGVEVGNHRFETGSGRDRRTHHWGFAAITLPGPLPHIVLDALGNNSLLRGGLPIDLVRSQRLGLEGDFDRHFALYCPAGYEADALYLFTPDVMARFIDRAAELDVEIVDDRLYLYSRRPLSTLDPETWQWIAGVIEALEQKAARWDRWRDERLAGVAGGSAPAMLRPPRGVGREGRRLAQRSGWIWMIVGIPLGLFGIWSMIVDALEFFGVL